MYFRRILHSMSQIRNEKHFRYIQITFYISFSNFSFGGFSALRAPRRGHTLMLKIKSCIAWRKTRPNICSKTFPMTACSTMFSSLASAERFGKPRRADQGAGVPCMPCVALARDEKRLARDEKTCLETRTGSSQTKRSLSATINST